MDGLPYLVCLGIDDLSANKPEFSEVLCGQIIIDSINLDFRQYNFFPWEGNPKKFEKQMIDH